MSRLTFLLAVALGLGLTARAEAHGGPKGNRWAQFSVSKSDHYRNRSFDPATGRFLQRDPVLGGDPLFNPYCFPGNNPVTNMDPMGDMVLHYYTYAAAVQKYCNEHGTPPGFTEVPTVLSIDYFRESSFRVCDGATGQWKVIKATDAQVYKLFGEPTFAPGEYGRIATASYTDRETGAMMLSDIKHIPGDFMKLGEQARKSGDPAFMVDALTKGMMRTAFYPIVAAVEGQKGDPRRHSIDTFNCVAFWGSMLAFGVGGEGGAAAAASRAAGEIELANGVTFVLDVDRALNPAVVGRLAGAAKGTNTAELAFLFRGTSEGFPGGAALQRLGITPASTDPGKATLFAIESSQYGEGVLHIVPRSNLPVGAIGPGNVLARTEAEVGVTMLPTEFAKRAQVTLPVDRARMLLQNIGVETPFMLRSKEQLRAALESAPAMTQEQTQQFLRGALRLEPAPASQGVPR